MFKDVACTGGGKQGYIQKFSGGGGGGGKFGYGQKRRQKRCYTLHMLGGG